MMRIGELAAKAGCLAETVRYYEKEGLLPPPGRTQANYRLYDVPHLDRLTFIRNCRALEMSLTEIRALLAIKDGAGRDCGEVNAVLEAHIGHVSERITQLTALKVQLVALRELCGGADAVERCGILRGLSRPDGAPEPCPFNGPPCPGCGGTVHRKKR